MDYSTLYKKIENYVGELFDKNQSKDLLYHNIQHTEKVVEQSKQIASHYNLTEEDQFILYTAAWFHDTGHLFVDPPAHERKSVELMKAFVSKLVPDEEILRKISDCILATRFPTNPKNILEMILCDADTYHLGTKEFKKTNKLLKKEHKKRKIPEPAAGWIKADVQFLESHRFFTEPAKQLLDAAKKENVARLKTKLNMKDKENGHPGTETEPRLFTDMSSTDGKTNKRTTNLITKGIQTMLRLTSENHLKLSEMADRKASILISVNSIIISVILSVLVRRLDVDSYLTIPTILFLTSSVLTIVFSILSTLPKVTEGTFSREDVMNKKTNLMFFGNFYRTTFEEYKWGMGQMMQDPDYLYGALTKDIYHLGVVLGRKYKLIRIAYYVFMAGIIISVLAFGIAVIFKDSGTTAAGNSSQMPL